MGLQSYVGSPTRIVDIAWDFCNYLVKQKSHVLSTDSGVEAKTIRSTQCGLRCTTDELESVVCNERQRGTNPPSTTISRIRKT